MGFDRMRIPLLRSLSGSLIGSSERRRSKSRSRRLDSASSAGNTTTDTPVPTSRDSASPPPPVPPVPPIPPIPIITTTTSSPRHVPGPQPEMLRKIWVKRPGASATRVEVNDQDLVDNVRDAILHKYANSLGRSIDSPDIVLKIVTRDPANKAPGNERVLGPEEPIGRTLDEQFPGGQTIEEALIIDVPQRRTPKPSPRPGNHHIQYYVPEQYRPADDAAQGYFPPMPVAHSPQIAHVQTQHGLQSMAVLTTGQLPPLPSPGGSSARVGRQARPKYGRQHTSSPTILHSQHANGAALEPKSSTAGSQSTNPLPTPPPQASDKPTVTPPNRVSSPRPGQRTKRKKNSQRSEESTPKPAASALLDGTVPPINVLLVEDNVINLKLLEAFMKRLKVRWQSAMNGKEAVAMWRTGGYHLVLMDIQLPVMNGLDATKEIRRLEAVNGIGVFSGSPIEGGQKLGAQNGENVSDEDKLKNRSQFKSPVIIVALTASSLQSDRHEALAAGCNDFLTKPVNFVWMERKVTEWGCMQALIDFDGWRKWKAYANAKELEDPAKKAAEEKEEKARTKAALKAMLTRPPPTTSKKSEEKPSQPNGVAKKPAAGSAGKTHKASRSSSGIAGGEKLGSVGEVDENAVK